MAGNETQQAVNLTVTNNGAPIRAGSYPGPYRIINQSLSATVWVSDNPACAPNQGTSVSPGTSLQWVKSGDLYLILGNDTESLAAGKAEIILSYDVSDWQPNPVAIATAVLNSGIIVVDKPVIAYNASLLDGNTTPPIPVDKYSSVIVNLAQSFCPVVSYATLSWLDENLIQISQQQIWFAANPVLPWEWKAAVPASGSYLQIAVSAPGGFAIDVKVVLSNRQVQGMNQYLPSLFAQEPNIGNFGPTAIGVGATLTMSSHPWFGDVEIDIQTSGALVPVQLSVEYFDIATGRSRRYMPIASNSNAAAAPQIYSKDGSYFQAGGTAGSLNTRMAMWGSPLLVRMKNRAASAVTTTATITPLRYNP